MGLRTYQAFTLEEVVARLRADLGDDAVVLHTRTFKRGGFFGWGGKTVIEVTASSVAALRGETGLAAGSRRKDQTAARKTSTRVAKSNSSDSDDHAARAAALAAVLAEQARRRQRVVEPKFAEGSNGDRAAAAPMRETPRRETLVAGAQRTAARSDESRPEAVPAARRFVVESGRVVSPIAKPQAASVAEPQAAAAKQQATIAGKPQDTKPQAELQREIASLKQMVGQVLQRQAGSMQPAMPEALFEQYLHLIEHEVAQEIADELCAAVRDELGPHGLDDPLAVTECFRKHLERYIPVAGDSLLAERPADARPLTIALIGPTGVGKTTTVAKLAAACKLRRHQRVGLVTTDTYRIAAVDQLRTYANIIGIPLKVALTPEEMAAACESLQECDVILIDTAGRSPNDASRVEEVGRFIEAADPHEVHLVLSSTFSEPVLRRTIEKFAPVRTDRVIFTKLDEAVSFGVLVNVMRDAGMRLSFVTTGQEVPDHLEVGRAERLARLVLGEKVSG